MGICLMGLFQWDFSEWEFSEWEKSETLVEDGTNAQKLKKYPTWGASEIF